MNLLYASPYNKCNPQLRTNKIEKILNVTKLIKSRHQPKNLKQILTLAQFWDFLLQNISEFNKKKYNIYNIIMEVKSNLSKHPMMPLKIKRNLAFNSKNVIHVI